MQLTTSPESVGCQACFNSIALDFDLTMAFQPIVDLKNGRIFAQEALVRGLNNEPAEQILAQVTAENLYKFDQQCRVTAVRLASKLNIESFLSINFLPNAVYRPENCLRTTIKAASEYNFPLDRIIFEITEGEKLSDPGHLKNIATEYKRLGLKIAIDDFGAGYSGLNLLASFQPDFLKLDMELIRDIDKDQVRQSIVRGIIQIAGDLNVTVIAEGIESKAELTILSDFGIDLFQGYYFARPAFESLAQLSPETFLHNSSIS